MRAKAFHFKTAKEKKQTGLKGFSQICLLQSVTQNPKFQEIHSVGAEAYLPVNGKK